MNAYFQLNFSNNSTMLDVYKETDGGKPININELVDYLNKKAIPFDLVSLNKEINSIVTNGSIMLDANSRLPEREMLVATVSPDKLSASCRFYPPSVGGETLTINDIIVDLAKYNIKYGINQEEIERFMNNRLYLTDYNIASAKPVVQGKDASIEYFFETDNKVKPQVNEDGSVDFFNLNAVHHIKEGDLLARLTREVHGEPGIDVTGVPIKPRDIKKLALKFGHNVTLSEDGTEVYSQVSGHVNLIDGTIFVSNVYEVENVDASTGNIEYNGSIKVNGNVNSNFTIKANGNIEVKGVVEGAYLYADGNIVIASGINGMGKGHIQAGGDVIVKYIENAKVIAGGSVHSEAIMHSNVSASDEIIVNGRKGNIAGSYVSAYNLVDVKTLGSPYGSDTVVQLGINPTMKMRMDELNENLEKANKQLAQLLPVLNAFKQKVDNNIPLSDEQKATFETMKKAVTTLLSNREDYLVELDSIKEMLLTDTKAQAIVRDVVYQGTKICIKELQMTLKSDYKYCKFYKDRGEVKYSSL